MSHSFSSLTCALLLLTPLAATAEPGAVVPWTTYFAADGETNGDSLASVRVGEIASEAVTRRAVRLSRDGDFVAWTASAPANTIVVRHCIADSPEGSGTTGTISLWINGKFRQKLTLDSHHAWLYGNKENAQGNSPADGKGHRYFDEIHAFISGAPLRAGDRVEMRREPGDVSWAVIDLADLELAPPPATAPENALSIIDFGATPNDQTDDTAAIEAAIAKAVVEHKSVWFPAGTFLQSKKIDVPGVSLSGAGPWYTRLTPTALATEAMGFQGNCGFRLTGQGAQVRELMIEGLSEWRYSKIREHAITLSKARDFVIENVWVEHTKTGMWLGNSEGGVIRSNRVRNTYADGINLNNAMRHVTVENNHCRNTGDDGLALFANLSKKSEEPVGSCHDVTFHHNTVDAPWWAHGIGVYGGDDIIVTDNLIRGTSRSPGMAIEALGPGGFTSWPGKNLTVTGNRLSDCGGTAWDQPWGGIWIHANQADFTAVRIERNEIIRPVYDGIKIQGRIGGSPGTLEAVIASNLITKPGANGILILNSAHGRVTLEDNRVTDLTGSNRAVENRAPAAAFTLNSKNSTATVSR